jgi:hypothetical protein
MGRLTLNSKSKTFKSIFALTFYPEYSEDVDEKCDKKFRTDLMHKFSGSIAL